MSDKPQGFYFAKVAQPSWSHSESMFATSEPLIEGIVYKLTKIPGIVVQRGVALFNDRCTTYHDPSKKTDATTWMLDRSCVLVPAVSSELAPKKRGIRPKGTWAITVAVQGVETFLELYEFKVDWPPSWAAAGYTDLVLGFTDLGEAVRWHDTFSSILAQLAAAKGQARANSTKALPDLNTTSAPVEASKPNPSAHVGAPQLNPTRSGPMASSDVPAQPAGDGPALPSAAPAAARSGATGAGAGAAPQSAVVHATWGPDDLLSDTDEEEDEDTPADSAEGRWVPYRQTNGVAIYYHAGEGKKSGGEYMVSCVIRGRPHRVAAALMRLRSNTTILGPAAHAEVLQRAEDKGGVGKEVLRLVLTGSGQAGFFCAPREVILERMRKDEDDGAIVILFQSVDLPNEASAQGTGNLYGSGLYRRPVRGVVAGGYTIAGLKGEGAASHESLVTCIVKLDLGGVCGEGSWVRPFASAAGWVDNFLDRILMSVNLLRDEVEQRRFTKQPFKMVASAKARFNQDGGVVGFSPSSASGSATSRPASAAASAPRLQARMASQRLSGVMAAAAAISEIPSIKEDGAVDPSLDVTSLRLDAAYVQSLCLMPRKFWAEVQVPGTDAPFSVRGPTYLKDKKKVLAGPPGFRLGALELIVLPPPGTVVAGEENPTSVVEHIARFVPSIRQGGSPFSIIINLIVPGSPMLSMLAVFCCDKHPSILGNPPASPMDEPHDWQPFDFVLHKFVYGSDETRSKMLKLIPHIAAGSWMIKQSVGTTPVIMGKALKTTYHCTPTYIEVDIDISANSVANYVTGMVRGATSSLVIDMAFVLEGTAPWELPECLLGALRLNRLDCKEAAPLDWSNELPVTTGKA